MLWNLPISLKVKCFSWLLLKDRFAVRDRLFWMGVIQEKENVCPICGERKKENWHLFVHYGQIYMLWARVAKLWGVNFVGAEGIGMNFDVWCHALPKGQRESIWIIAFVASKEYGHF